MTELPIGEKAPTIEDLARVKLGMPPEWKLYFWKALPPPVKGESGWKPYMVQIKGVICPETISRGKNKGRPNWRKRDKASERIAYVTDVEHEAAKRHWERATGKCSNCDGSGQEWSGWSAANGNSYRECHKCKGQGSAPDRLS